MIRVEVKPELLRWARERAGLSTVGLCSKFPKIEEWERGESHPTLKQLEAFAKVTCVPVGYLFLPEPPEERIPIPDLRVMGGKPLGAPSPDLLDVMYLCQRRQAWFRDHARLIGEEPLRFVGSVTLGTSVGKTADQMTRALEFDLAARHECSTWTEALRRFIESAEELGALVMVSSVVGTNNWRKLNPGEFRGFALADDLAPLVFINGADAKAAQMFTLAHELAHLWLGESAVSDVGPASSPSHRIERWCNAVAAEFLVPSQVLCDALPPDEPLAQIQNLARKFKVSTLVILRRLLDVRRISRDVFQKAYDKELDRLRRQGKSKGGDFYLTQEARASRRFVRALVASTLEGQTLYREAFQLLGIKKESTFAEWGRRLGVYI